MSKILITAGPTNEYIDEVMKITNMSSGRTGLEIARHFKDLGHEVHLVGNKFLTRDVLFKEYGLESCAFTVIETTQDMLAALAAMAGQHFDLVVHNSAVGDYKADAVFTMEMLADELTADPAVCAADAALRRQAILKHLTAPECAVNSHTKISSYEPNLTVKLGLTPKIISNLRTWFPNAKLVGFKLLDNVTKSHIISVATALCAKNNLDYVIANDLSLINQGRHLCHVVDENGYTGRDLEGGVEIAAFLKTLL
ncbi:phosphopantothenate-cysteine ligase [Elusimicrobium simillimum]|uniref:phosphopantothenoylcysteine decarboxylase domain-containing protein n=1 Tax=Elusimicrobium simillimum TaxID=3143438 RepID=UPI003C6F7D15